jgi:hypothetical protein
MVRRDAWTFSVVLVLVAFVCFLVALLAVIFEIDEPKLYPAMIAAGLCSWAASLIVP